MGLIDTIGQILQIIDIIDPGWSAGIVKFFRQSPDIIDGAFYVDFYLFPEIGISG
jgi:hypothetical protein